jgi:mono/diheme cytochrome c family protein
MAGTLVGFIAAGCASSGKTEITSGPAPTVNADFRVDATLAQLGGSVYQNKGCYMCHRIGDGRAAGPDLFGVTERRPIEWLTKFLKDTDDMLNSDDVAKALLAEFHHQRMPNIPMTDQQIQGLIHYLQDTANKMRSRAGE